jgi:hypothetical protein
MLRWRRAFEKTGKGCRVRAIDLYGGGVWGDLRTHYEERKKKGIEIRIVSAGMGLLSPDDRVPVYDATFAPGSKNAIGGVRGTTARNREWWRLLGDWNGKWHEPRSLYATVKQYPKAAHIVALPLDYMNAVLEDLRAIAAENPLWEKTILLAAPYSFADRLIPGAVEVPGDLYGALGGTRGTVLARAGMFVADKLVGESSDRNSVIAALQPLQAKTRPLPIRITQTNAEIRRYLIKQLRADRSLGRSVILARLRGDGFACERTRFNKMFEDAREKLG